MITLKRYVFYIGFFITFVSAQGPDPWDRVASFFKNDDNTAPENPVCLSDKFYKRIIQLLLMKGTFETSNNHIYGYLQFKFTNEEYDLLEKFSQFGVTLTGSEFRKVDVILNEKLIVPTFMEKIATKLSKFVYRFIENNHVFITTSVVIMISMYYIIYVIDWKYYIPSVSSFLTVRVFVIILFIILYCWECKIAKEEADVRDYKNMASGSSWFPYFWSSNNNNLNIEVSYIYEALHPANILTKMASKFFTTPAFETFTMIEKYASFIHGKCKFPVNIIVYTLIVTVLPTVFIILLCVLLFSIVFGRTFSMGFLGLNFGLKINQNQDSGSTAFNHNNAPPSPPPIMPQINIYCNTTSPIITQSVEKEDIKSIIYQKIDLQPNENNDEIKKASSNDDEQSIHFNTDKDTAEVSRRRSNEKKFKHSLSNTKITSTYMKYPNRKRMSF